MTRNLTLLGGSLWLILASGLANLVLLLFNLTMVRVYGFSAHGKFVYFLSVIALFRLIMDAGIGSLITKQLGNRIRPLKDALVQGLGWMALLNLPIMALIALKPEFIVGKEDAALGIFALWFFAMLVENISASIFNGLQAMHFTFLASLIMEGTKLTLVVYLWLSRPSLEFFSVIANTCIFIASLIVLGIIGFTLLKISALKTRLNPELSPELNLHEPPITEGFTYLKAALVLWVSTAGATLMPQIMNLLIKFGLSNQHVSFYNAMASWSLVGAIMLTPAANAMFAWISRHESGRASQINSERNDLLYRYFRWCGIISMGCALALLGAGKTILGLYGNEIMIFTQVYALLVLAQLADYPRFFTVPFLSGGSHAHASMVIELVRFFLILLACTAAIFSGLGLLGIAWSIYLVQFAVGMTRIIHIRNLYPRALIPAYIGNLTAALIAYGIFSLHFQLIWQTLFLLLIFLVFSGIRWTDFKFIYQRSVKI